jgi:hypothetical protein
MRYREAALVKARAVTEKLDELRSGKAAVPVLEGIGETLVYMAFRRRKWWRLRTDHPLRRVMRELRRTQVVGASWTGVARLRHVAARRWGKRKYSAMSRLYEAGRERPWQVRASARGLLGQSPNALGTTDSPPLLFRAGAGADGP